MGWQRAAHVLFTGAWVDAQEAVDFGIALERCSDDEVLSRALELAAEIATAPLAALRAIKRTMLEGQRDGIAAARAREDSAFAAVLGFAEPV
jgi:enoyl-CoA hydratase/carnithine racemase